MPNANTVVLQRPTLCDTLGGAGTVNKIHGETTAILKTNVTGVEVVRRRSLCTHDQTADNGQ